MPRFYVKLCKQEDAMRERRNSNRKNLAVYSRVFDRTSGRVLGYLSDLTKKGAMIISDSPMSEKIDISLRFDLPDPDLFSTDHLNMDARVAWCSPDIDPAFYNVGFEFTALSANESRIIDEMIEAYEFRHDLPDYPIPPSSL
jgi:hypothetical protein